MLIALVLRNLWVWLHWRYFAEGCGDKLVMHLERLRFRRLLNWIAHVITPSLHDGTAYSTSRKANEQHPNDPPLTTKSELLNFDHDHPRST